MLQTDQKHIGKWREAIEVEMNIRQSETYRRPSDCRCAKAHISTLRSIGCKEYKCYRGSSLLSTKCVRFARTSEKPYELLCKMFAAVPGGTTDELESILGKKFMRYALNL